MGDELCDDCKKLVGAGRHTPAHENLVQTKFVKVSSALGPSDERYYTCDSCGHEWLHETGSQGFGWIK